MSVERPDAFPVRTHGSRIGIRRARIGEIADAVGTLRQIDRRRHRLFGEREGVGEDFGIPHIAETQLMQVGRILRFVEGDVAARTPHLAVIGDANLFNRLSGVVFEKDAPQHLAD